MTRFMIYPYKPGSEGAKAIRDALDVEPDTGLLIRRENSQYVRRDTDVIISWGTTCPYEGALNRDPSIAINKKDFYERLAGRNIVPPFTLNRTDAVRSLHFPVLCRQRVEGADGDGCVIAETPEALVTAPLYVQLINKTSEWRVHAGRLPDGTISIIAAQKKLHTAVAGLDPRIWTGDSTRLTYDHNGAPRPVLDVVHAAMNLLPELTFGGFDVVFDGDLTSNTANRAYVVEVNSAPMMTDRTAEAYATFFRNFVQPEPVVIPESEIVPTGSTFDTRPIADLERRIDEVLAQLFNHSITSRDVIIGYINFLDRLPPA